MMDFGLVDAVFYIIILLISFRFLTFLSSKTDDENWFVRYLALVLRYFTYGNGERVMFLPDNLRPCRTFIDSLKKNRSETKWPCPYYGSECRYYHGWDNEEACALAEVLRTLSSAKESVFVCMYSFTNDTLSNFLKYLKRSKNIQVLVLTDNQQQGRQENDQIEGLVDAGFEVRSNPGASMHNKYCIIDEKIMISGSLNWTHAAFNSNDEMLTWTKNPRIVREVSRKFQRCYRLGSQRLKKKSPVTSNVMQERVQSVSNGFRLSSLGLPIKLPN